MPLPEVNVHLRSIGKCLFGPTGLNHRHALLLSINGRLVDTGLLQQPTSDQVIHIITTKRGITAGGQHFKHAFFQAQYGNIKRATTEIVHGYHALTTLVQAVGHCCCRGLIQQAIDFQAGEPGGIFGGLTLGIIKVGRHGNNGTVKIATKGLLCPVRQLTQNGR